MRPNNPPYYSTFSSPNTASNINNPQQSLYPSLQESLTPQMNIYSTPNINQNQYANYAQTPYYNQNQTPQLNQPQLKPTTSYSTSTNINPQQNMYMQNVIGNQFICQPENTRNNYPELPNQSSNAIYGWLQDIFKSDKNNEVKYIEQIGLNKLIKRQGEQIEPYPIGNLYSNFPLYQNPNANGFPSPFIKYKIIPLLDEKKALDVCSTNDKKKGLKKNGLIIWDYHGGPNQLFYLLAVNQFSCFIINLAKGFTAQFSQKDRNQEAPLVAHVKTNTKSQLWRLVPSQTFFGCFQIINEANGLAMDLFHQESSNGTKVIQYKRTGKRNQQWRIVPS